MLELFVNVLLFNLMFCLFFSLVVYHLNSYYNNELQNNFFMTKCRYLTWKFICLLCLIVASECQDMCKNSDPEFLVTFHPHLDAFWLNSDNQLKDIKFVPQQFLYSMNQRNSKTIFNSMLKALEKQSERKYFITQVVFFKDWYEYLPIQEQRKVIQLIQNEQLQIANGAWVENDQAVCYFEDILDQYTLGHQYLYSNFNYQVKVGWATDSFGHSHSQVALEHILGIQFQGIQRVDDRYVNEHHNKSLLQFFWSPFSDSNNLTYGGVLNHIRHFLHQVNDLRATNIKQIERDFTQLQAKMKSIYGKQKLFRFLGNDFQEFIPEQFEILEKAFAQMNSVDKQESGQKEICSHYKYGNPSDYLRIITEYYKNKPVPMRHYDLIPNWDQDRYWSGYFTTDPQLKKNCRDYSRLVNLYRKIILAQQQNVKNSKSQTLLAADELLSVIQHHDGITATSKTYIQDEFKKRMENSSRQILKGISQIYNSHGNEKSLCQLYKNNNKCKFNQEWVFSNKKQFKLSVISMGVPKLQKIQITNLPENMLLKAQDNLSEIFCQTNSYCTLLMEVQLFPGINDITIRVQNKDQLEVIQMKKIEKDSLMKQSYSDYSLQLIKQTNQIVYRYGDNLFYKFGFYVSANKGIARQTKAWDKYGNKNLNTQHITPGMYIMSNNGELQKLGHNFTEMNIWNGNSFRKFIFKSNIIKLQVITKVDQPNILDLQFSFQPPNNIPFDYFLKASSHVQSSILYHDSNGYLVSKRLFNSRPDYQFTIHNQDRINANTYPATSFAYLIQNNQKFIFFSDRAQGVCAYNQSLLINFDRLAYDDGKGVGQGYLRRVHNIFHYKFGVVSAGDDIQRIWQREYDEGSIGYINQRLQSESNDKMNRISSNKKLKYLKYSVFHLNSDEIVLRLINLAQFDQIQIIKYNVTERKGNFEIGPLGLNLNFVDIVQSYANGIPIENQGRKQEWRKYWGENPDQININSHYIQDKQMLLTLRPLQIRSFRINFKNKIIRKEGVQSSAKAILMQNKLKEIKKTSFLMRRKCF